MARSGGSLGAYAVARVALALPMVLILLTMVFLLMRVAPGDPVQSAVGGRLPPDQIAEIRTDAGLDEPLVVQYFDYLGDVATLDFGETITDNRQVTDVLLESGGATLTLTLAALVVAVGLGLPLGLLAGRYRDTGLDASLRVFGILTYAAPVFFVGLLAQLTFGSMLGWLPTSGEADPVTFVPEVTHILLIDSLIAGDFEAFQDALLHLILPAVTLGLLVTGVFLRLTRVNVMQALNGDYIEAARARGIGERSVVIRHAFRNAFVPVITVMGLQVALLLSGATLTEVTFDWPGLGSELYAYLNERDYIAVQGLITVFALIVVVVSIVIDLVTAMIDPEGPLLMAVASGLEVPEPSRQPADDDRRTGDGGARRPSRIGRALKPFRDARGQARWLLWIGLALTLVFVLVAVFAPWLAPYDFNQVSTVDGGRFPKQAPPSAEHWFGTSVRSEDVLSRVIYATRTAVEVTVLAVVVSMLIGVPLGLIAGYFGGWLDRVLVLISDALFAFPYLLLALVIAFLLSDVIGGGVITAAMAITVVYVPQYFRVVRNSTLSAREATYVEAARALGARPRTVISKYIFSNVIHSVPVIATLNAADAMLTLAGLGFLGYGIQPSEGAEWGYDLQRALPDIAADIWWTGLFPGMAIVLFVVGLTLVGEGLNDTLNPTLRKRRIEPVHIPPRPAGGDERTGA